MKKAVLALTAAALVGAAGWILTQGPAANAQQAATTDGRFVIVYSPNVRADTFLLDTSTGRTWGLVQYTYLVGEPRAWKAIDQVGSDASIEALENKYGLKAKPEK